MDLAILFHASGTPGDSWVSYGRTERRLAEALRDGEAVFGDASAGCSADGNTEQLVRVVVEAQFAGLALLCPAP